MDTLAVWAVHLSFLLSVDSSSRASSHDMIIDPRRRRLGYASEPKQASSSSPETNLIEMLQRIDLGSNTLLYPELDRRSFASLVPVNKQINSVLQRKTLRGKTFDLVESMFKGPYKCLIEETRGQWVGRSGSYASQGVISHGQITSAKQLIRLFGRLHDVSRDVLQKHPENNIMAYRMLNPSISSDEDRLVWYDFLSSTPGRILMLKPTSVVVKINNNIVPKQGTGWVIPYNTHGFRLMTNCIVTLTCADEQSSRDI
jgi:hypothetical protein